MLAASHAHLVAMVRCCSPSCWVAVVAVGVGLNFHYALLGDSAIRGALGSAALVTGGNGVWRLLTVRKMRGEGLAVGGSRTVRIRAALDVDVYEPPAGAALRPAALYFHAGAYSSGFREFAAGTLGFLAAEGVVGVAVGYRLTSAAEGAGLAGCLDDARAALAWVRDHAAELRVDPKRVVAMGDSAGGHLALLLGLDDDPPRAVFAGWPVTTVEPRYWLTYCEREGRAACAAWRDTPAADDLNDQTEGANVFLGPGPHRATEAATREHLAKTFAGVFLLFGRRAGGWLPPAYDDDVAVALSPLAVLLSPSRRHAVAKRKRGLPPTLAFVGDNDTVVPPGQQRPYAEAYRAAGGDFAVVEFAGGDHGDGGVNAAAGRDALRSFLAGAGVLPRAAATDDAGHHVDRAKRAIGLKFLEYPRGRFDYGKHKRATVRLEEVAASIGAT